MNDYAPSPADKFSFGLWTVGFQGADPFGAVTRPALDAVRAVHRLADLGAWGVTFHDDDLVPFGSSGPDRDRVVTRFRSALDETGLADPQAAGPRVPRRSEGRGGIGSSTSPRTGPVDPRSRRETRGPAHRGR